MDTLRALEDAVNFAGCAVIISTIAGSSAARDAHPRVRGGQQGGLVRRKLRVYEDQRKSAWARRRPADADQYRKLLA